MVHVGIHVLRVSDFLECPELYACVQTLYQYVEIAWCCIRGDKHGEFTFNQPLSCPKNWGQHDLSPKDLITPQ